MTVIRLATSADARELARLRFEFRTERAVASESEADFVARCTPWMAARLAGESWRCWVAEAGGRVVGHLWLHLVEKIPNPVPELELIGYITNVYVQPHARGAGLAGEMLDAAIAQCRERGVDSVVLWPSELSRPLYARHGFAEPTDLLEAILDDGRLSLSHSPDGL